MKIRLFESKVIAKFLEISRGYKHAPRAFYAAFVIRVFDEHYRISGGYKKIQSKKFAKCLDTASSLPYDTHHASGRCELHKHALALAPGRGPRSRSERFLAFPNRYSGKRRAKAITLACADAKLRTTTLAVVGSSKRFHRERLALSLR